MAKITRRTLLGACSGSLLLSISPTAWARAAAQMVAVRIWPATAYTRMTLESDSALQYKQFTLANPNRLVVDIQGASLNSVLQTLPQKVLPLDPYIASVRVGQFNADTIRVVLDLKTGVNPQVFTLRPVADFKHRLVVDLYPSTSVALAQEQNDPLMALLQDYSRGKVNSDGTTQASEKAQSAELCAKAGMGSTFAPALNHQTWEESYGMGHSTVMQIDIGPHWRAPDCAQVRRRT